MDKHIELTDEDLGEALTYPVEAFICPEYAKAEHEKLWPKVWQMAGRLEDIPEPGMFLTYNIGDESIIVLRLDEDTLKAYYNVCPHRGRQLINSPDSANGVRGRRKNLVCGFHGWTFDLEGNNIYVHDEQDWKGVLTPELTCLS